MTQKVHHSLLEYFEAQESAIYMVKYGKKKFECVVLVVLISYIFVGNYWMIVMDI
jgi:hypothetical protein